MSIKAYRTRYLADRYHELLAHIRNQAGRRLAVLDLGCGNLEITRRMAATSRDDIERISGMDIYAPDPAVTGPVGYLRWDGKQIPLADSSLDVVVLSDVLHHIYPLREQVLRETVRVAEWLIVKDHFERGLLSRGVLWGFDLLGNWQNARYGANVLPQRYLDRQGFHALCRETGYRVVSLDIGHNVYGDHFRYLFPPRYQFIALLQRATAPAAGNGLPEVTGG